MSVEKISKELEMRHGLERRVALIYRFEGGWRMGGREGDMIPRVRRVVRDERAEGGRGGGGKSRDRERGNGDDSGCWSQKRTPKRRIHQQTHG